MPPFGEAAPPPVALGAVKGCEDGGVGRARGPVPLPQSARCCRWAASSLRARVVPSTMASTGVSGQAAEPPGAGVAGSSPSTVCEEPLVGAAVIRDLVAAAGCHGLQHGTCCPVKDLEGQSLTHLPLTAHRADVLARAERQPGGVAIAQGVRDRASQHGSSWCRRTVLALEGAAPQALKVLHIWARAAPAGVFNALQNAAG